MCARERIELDRVLVGVRGLGRRPGQAAVEALAEGDALDEDVHRVERVDVDPAEPPGEAAALVCSVPVVVGPTAAHVAPASVLVKKPLKLPRAVLEIRYARFGSLSLKSTPILPTRLSGVCSAGLVSLCGSGGL